jgi:uncharacterized membrane protein YjjB (DUF3815 family)
MGLLEILIDSLWAGLFAGGLGIVFTAPPRYLVPAFLCGFAGRFARDVLMSWGLTQNWSTVVAAAVLVLVAVAMVRGHVVSPVVLVSGLIPLGAALAMFKAIMALMQVSSLQGEALREASDVLSANAGKVFTTTLAIALGLAVGIAIVRLARREKVWEGV